MTTLTVGMADAKTNFSRITANVNATGIPVTVFKNNKPWVEICPLAAKSDSRIPKETLEAMREIEDMHVHPENYKRYHTAEELFEDLGI